MKPIIQEVKPTISYENHPRNNSTQKISEILKRTNQLIQQGEFDRAQGELILANRAAKEQFKKELVTAPAKEKFISAKAQLTPLPLKPIEALISTISPKQKVNVQPEANTSSQKNASIKPSEQQTEQSTNRDIEFDYYRGALTKAWCDGVLAEDEERLLHELRTVLEISDTEHEMLENEVKKACYEAAVNEFISKGSSTILNAKSIAEIQEIFHISQEESLQIRNQLLCTDESKPHDRILIIDDDTQFLELLTDSMAEDGFDVTAVTTSDEAYAILQENTPDLILCDINLETSTMDGFTFYKKVQNNRHLQQIPFVFLTGLTDENLAHTGRELGADDYLIKPISRTTLVSAIRGRIKRFKELRGYSDFQIPVIY
jgi:CheY-like chemotaxis protein